jgi:bifunctional DNA-binding transcriptional regulator/antitoxin component of YhaV-PrlF toxin-antitoxin module
MTVVVKSKPGLLVPPSVRRKAGIKTGDQVEFKVTGGVIHIFRKPPIAEEEYTPAQRRAVARELAKGLEDVRKGRTHGPFDTADDAVKFLRKEIKSRKSKLKR